ASRDEARPIARGDRGRAQAHRGDEEHRSGDRLPLPRRARALLGRAEPAPEAGADGEDLHRQRRAPEEARGGLLSADPGRDPRRAELARERRALHHVRTIGGPSVSPSLARRRFAIAAASALCAVAACEIGLRVYLCRFADAERLRKYARFDDLPPEAHVFRGHPFTNYRLNVTYRSRDGASRHDALGLRGPEVAVPKPEGAYRIVCIG